MTLPSPNAPALEVLDTLPARLPPPDIDPAELDVDSLKVVARLRRHGHIAYLVGGCVRDLWCGAAPKDYDVATSAHPEQIRDIFRNSRLVGRRFRLAHVWFSGGKIIEVATFRANPSPPEASETLAESAEGEEGEESEVSEPVDLLVTDDNQFGSAEEDARRRDFTVNGLFYDPVEGTIIDYVQGRADLEARLIRTIGEPEVRLREDPVRGLRAARIAAKLGFGIEPETFAAMSRHAGELPRCAPARVLEETLKLLRSGASRSAFTLLRRAGILKVLLPPIEELLVKGGEEIERQLFARLDALDHLLEEGHQVSDAVMLATLLSFLPDEEDEEEEDSPLPSADSVLSRMSAQARLPRRVADRVRAVLAAQKFFVETPKKKKRRRKSSGGAGFVRTPHFAESLQLFEVSVRATGANQAALELWKRRAEDEAARKALAPSPAEPRPPEPPPVVEEKPAEEEKPAAAKKKRRRGGKKKKTGEPSPEAKASDEGE